jgi:hypothetical protein
MKRTLVTLTLLAALQLASGQEQLPRKDALKYAFLLSLDLKALQGTPIATDVDLKQPVAVRGGDHGALVLPEAKLSADAIARAGEQVVSVGQLWLRKLTPVRESQAIPGSQLRIVNIENEGETASAVQCALGVKGDGAGGLELLVFGKDKTPVLKVPLKKTQGPQDAPISVKAERAANDTARLTLSLVGRYEATVTLTELAE